MQSITLQTSDTVITSGDILGRLNYAASAEADGSAAILIAGSVYVQAEGSFQSSSNPSAIVFATAAADSSSAVARLKIDQNGNLVPYTNDTYNLGSSSLRFNNVNSASGDFEYIALDTSNNIIPKIQFTGSGVNDTPINLEVASSFESATGSGSALLFQGTQGQLFSVTDNLSSGTIFSVSDITGLPMLEIDASGHVQIGEFADDITLHQAVLLSGGVPASTTNKLYNDAGTLYWNGSSLSGYDDTYVSGVATYASGQAIENETDIALKANIASPTFTGTPAAPTASAGTNTTQIATTAFVSTAVANLVDSAPTTLDTLNELAAALGDDANFSTTVTNSIATKLANVVEDTTPQLGGTLDANGNTIDMGTYVITDAKVGQWDTAYGWGDHGSAGYLTAHPTISAASSSDNSGRTYIQDVILDSNGHVTGLATATETVTDTTYTAGAGITLTGTTFNVNVNATTQTVAANTVSATSSRTYAVQVNASDELVVNVPWTDTDTNTQLSQEQVEDFAGNLIATGGTKTGITVTYQDSTNDVDFVVGGLTTTEIAASTLVTEAEGISSNDNDTTIPTSAAVKDYVDNNAGGGGTVQGTDGTYDIQPTNEGATAGNTRGEGSVDLQTHRSAATQVASGGCSVISGGANNTASGYQSTVSGGNKNIASGYRSFVGGGGGSFFDGNTASGGYSAVVAGTCNTSCGSASFIGGGQQNISSHAKTTVSGGKCNTASAYYSTVGGGFGNTASNVTSTVGGGHRNTASGNSSTIAGGRCNTTSAVNSSVSGGYCNITNARHSIIAGGHRNIIQSPTNECCSRGVTIGGGVGHNSSGGTLNATTGDLTGTITCCNAGAFSTIAGGLRHCATGACSSVGGGTSNTASGGTSTVSGGCGNTASGGASAVGGGYNNTASGYYSTVGGGGGSLSSLGNTASGIQSTVSGGYNNTASGQSSAVGGGGNNTASSYYSTIGGGRGNIASGYASTVSGGYYNTASAFYSSVAGGCCNITNARHSIIAGGHRNIIQSPTNECCSRGATIGGGVGHNSSGGTLDVITGDLTGTITCCDAGRFSTIAGGLRNVATGLYSTVSGGSNNTASNANSTVSGGGSNTASGNASIISGGAYNTASGSFSTIVGGYCSDATGTVSTVGGGWSNTVSGYASTIGGGRLNTASAKNSSVVGGCCNITNARHSIIAGGHRNIIQSPTNECCSRGVTIGGGVGHNSSGGTLDNNTGDLTGTITCCNAGAFSTIAGGLRNCATGVCSTVGGGCGNTASATSSTVSGGLRNTASSNVSAVGGGKFNTASGGTSTISGGYGNTASGSYSTVGGGGGYFAGNIASGSHSTVGGGFANTASGACSTVSGGGSNTASAYFSTVAGGCCNITNARHSIIAGGHRNIIQSPTNECCSRGVTIGGGVGHNSSGGTLNATTGDLTGTITCCNAGRFSTIGGGCRNVATGSGSTVAGGWGNTASGNSSTVGGGYGNTASSGSSTVSGGSGNTASGYYSVVVGGGGLYGPNAASGNYSIVAGGDSNTASGSHSAISGGTGNTASGTRSTVGGGRGNTASATYSTVSGGYYGKATRYGETSHAAGRFAATGDAQHTVLVARDSTTDATANQVLFLNGSSERLTIPAETTWMFTVKLAAHNDTDNDGGWWFFRGGIRRDAANNTSLIGTVFEEYSKDSNISSATASVVADDTNEALEIRVTGVASKNIRWVAVVDISQVSWGTP